MRLPDKVQKTQFTREEQLLLAGRYETVIPDAIDDVFYKFGHQRNQSIPTLRTSSVSSQSSLDIDFFSDSDSDSDMDESMMESFRWMDEDDDLDLSLDDYHTHMASTTESSPKNSSPRPSFRRSLSLTNLPLASKSSVATSPDPPKPTRRKPFNAIPHISTQYAKPKSPSKPSSPAIANFPPNPMTPTHYSLTPRHIIETSARHYQDPEARLKLRVYLASPQKFDEALEFGFPALLQAQETSILEAKETSLLQAKEIHIAPRRPSPSKQHHTAPSAFTWYHNNPSADSLDSDSDTTSLPQTPCTPAFHSTSPPQTPCTPPFREPYSPSPHSPSTHSPSLHSPPPRNTTSTDTDALHPRKPPVKPYTHVLSGSREMTLRMTLTRPDLRKDDEQPDSIYGEEDPLVLEQMPSLVGGGDIWDSLPLREGVVKKLWQKVSRRGGGV
ncbi:hypothetical protein MMC22_008709 [Lobaria immixta]|nr:hypothetical protein [Lobaria immixta]